MQYFLVPQCHSKMGLPFSHPQGRYKASEVLWEEATALALGTEMVAWARLPPPALRGCLPAGLPTFLEHVGWPHPHGAGTRRAAGQLGVTLVVVDGAAGTRGAA